MYQTLLWDLDGTVLDFQAAERAAMRTLFAEFSLGTCSDAMLARYSAINQAYWRRLERGEIEKEEMLLRRFADFFGAEGIGMDAARFHAAYQVRLGDTIVFLDGADSLLRRLQAAGFCQCAITNGTRTAQRRKLERAGLYPVFNHVFISDEIGAEKPSPLFFDHVLAALGHPRREELLIIGDSLTSDIRGGRNAGIATCWYNPGHMPCLPEQAPDYQIDCLSAILPLLQG